MAFRRPTPPQPNAETPEALFGVLPRTGAGHTTLWVHQGDVLRSFYDKFRDHPDLAIELPTGTGKTLPGLLIADWNRRTRTERAVFACPTVQLVRQVVEAARRQSIPVVDLSGSWRDWDPSDRLKFEQAQAVGIATYSAIFNIRPHLEDLGTVVFDDAHAGEQYVAGAYSLIADRRTTTDLYEALRSCLANALPDGVAARLREEVDDPGVWGGVNLVLPAAHEGLVKDLETALVDTIATGSPASFAFSALRAHLHACLVYVSRRQILIRPFIPPTFENHVFFEARQRIYLSATLGTAGELERSFGRERISRLPLPSSAGVPRSGRRFIVFPTLVRGVNSEDLTRSLIEKAGRAIVLTPSGFGVDEARKRVVPLGWTVFDRARVESGFGDFASTPSSVCILANRYDGIDLPADACRSVALFGYPKATHLQEDFLASRARALSAIAERIRARVIQGTGRCTRGPEDYALVIVADDDTATYLARPDVQRTFDPALQAEVQFGFTNSEVQRAELLENVEHFFAQDSVWRDDAEPAITSLQSGLTRRVSPSDDALGTSAAHEVVACQLAWQGVWNEASVAASLAAASMTGQDDIRPYRAFWLLVAAYFENIAARAGAGGALEVAEAKAQEALAAAQPQTWVREVLPFPGLGAAPVPPEDWRAANAIAGELHRSKFKVATNQQAIKEMLVGLSQTSSRPYEGALSTLGKLLGADAFKPEAPGNCDSAWCWGNEMWLAVEAKSEESPDSALSMDTVRQANTQLALLSDARDGAPIPIHAAASIVVSPRTAIDSGAVTIARPSLYLVDLAAMAALGEEVEKLWEELRPIRNTAIEQSPQLVLDALRRRRLLPSNVFEALTRRRIAAD